MEISLAVTNSLAALSRGFVFCTEPFRIPYAGRLDVLCFDKTGTLTQDKMIMKAVAGVRAVVEGSTDGESDESLLRAMQGQPVAAGSTTDDLVDAATLAESCPEMTLAVMGGCNSLLVLKGEVGGEALTSTLLTLFVVVTRCFRLTLT